MAMRCAQSVVNTTRSHAVKTSIRGMATAERRPSPRATKEEEDALLLARYGVMPTPGCQIKTPPADNICDWNPKPLPIPEPAAATPSVLTVFGGKGFIGKEFIKKVATQFEEIRIVGRSTTPVQGLEGNIKYIEGDVTDIESVFEAVNGAGTVVNLVGILYETSTQSFFNVQYEGAKNVAYASKASGVANFVHMSALGSSDDSACKYAQSKGWGEGVVKAAFPEATILKPSVVFGAGDGFFNRFAEFPLPFLPLVGGGETKFQPVHVDDVAEALSVAATSDVAKGKTVECVGPEVKSFKELMEQMQEITGTKKPMLPVPFWAAEIQGGLMQFMPEPMVTRDQVLGLKTDNVASGAESTLTDIGVTPATLGDVLPTFLKKK
eukprot:TRINITY_DN8809_c0_g1_i1.p1 TRINITY_DN8809_c0_g1~~TRINITY_DN8809_c0_g1_i1.p1  ORF type:complete len:380 (+),score=93.08 TRINITY_DN8809_c0_g1_i1:146-1285(+)